MAISDEESQNRSAPGGFRVRARYVSAAAVTRGRAARSVTSTSRDARDRTYPLCASSEFCRIEPYDAHVTFGIS
ncbi:hypothetical protein EVAR_42406_1 [Eumeta japonica]|uniref:Uncharacterized protein n=1 Tax=Eumeta variegata TaxID=151549 RepID=A0A4C1X6U6_EUMVA|nr:hypothetical protein EVAR_42406_1 [Eumeta japonica]